MEQPDYEKLQALAREHFEAYTRYIAQPGATHYTYEEWCFAEVLRLRAQVAELARAAAEMDWQQVAFNGGPPCFHLEGGRFCARAERWPGHGELHEFVSLEALLRSAPAPEIILRCSACKSTLLYSS